ncbi:MAG: PilZ domain-containing protein [Acidobacteriia bacterium]|nr:PilZ domain-containing protein [Terriglobia bacterium]
MAGDEKRKTPRFKPKDGTHIVFVEGSAAIRDLSENGMYVLDGEPLSEGSAIKFALRLANFDLPIEGIVSRSVPGQGMVIQFTEMTREARRRLRIYLSELGPASQEPRKS